MLNIQVDVSQEKLPNLTEGQISRLTRGVASRVRKAVMEATPVGNRPLRGRKRTKASWTGIKKDEGGYSFDNPLVQSWFLEYGSAVGKKPWPSAKTRTVYSKGRIYSSQASGGIVLKSKAEEIANQVASDLFHLLIQGKSLAQR